MEREVGEPYWSTCEPPGEMPCVKKMLHISPLDMGKIIKFIEKVCEKQQNCVAEDVEEAQAFLDEMEEQLEY